MLICIKKKKIYALEDNFDWFVSINQTYLLLKMAICI